MQITKSQAKSLQKQGKKSVVFSYQLAVTSSQRIVVHQFMRRGHPLSLGEVKPQVVFQGSFEKYLT